MVFFIYTKYFTLSQKVMLLLNLCYFYYFFIKMIQKNYKEINILKFKKYFSLFLVLILIFSSIPEFAVLAYQESQIDKTNTEEKTDTSVENLTEVIDERTPYTKTLTDGDRQFYK